MEEQTNSHLPSFSPRAAAFFFFLVAAATTILGSAQNLHHFAYLQRASAPHS